MNTAGRTSDRRRAELAQIHIAKKQLGLDQDTYERMLFTQARVMTSAELDEHGRRKVIAHLRACGFVNKQSKRSFPGRPHNCDSNPQLLKVEAILADGKKPWAYADAMAKKMFSVDRLTFCNPDQLQRLIAALTYNQQRQRSKV